MPRLPPLRYITRTGRYRLGKGDVVLPKHEVQRLKARQRSRPQKKTPFKGKGKPRKR